MQCVFHLSSAMSSFVRLEDPVDESRASYVLSRNLSPCLPRLCLASAACPFQPSSSSSSSYIHPLLIFLTILSLFRLLTVWHSGSSHERALASYTRTYIPRNAPLKSNDIP